MLAPLPDVGSSVVELWPEERFLVRRGRWRMLGGLW